MSGNDCKCKDKPQAMQMAACSVSGLAKEDTLDGQPHLVVPVVAIVEGVLNDSLVLADEFGAMVEAWNGIPVPVGHPKEGERFVSANSKAALEKFSVGRFLNAKMDGAKLVGELWLDVQAARRKGYASIVEALKKSEPFEVSVGFFSQVEPVEGELNGKKYAKIDRAIRPDHIAILVDEIGACSWEDGCGAPRVNAAGRVKGALAAMAAALGLKSKGVQAMDKTEVIAKLIEGGHFSEDEKADLEQMSDDFLAKVTGLFAKSDDKEEETEAKEEGADEKKEDEPVVNHKLSAEVQQLVAYARAKMDAERNEMIGKIKANKSNKMNDAQLAGMDLPTLTAFASSLPTTADYSVFAGGATVQGNSKIAPLVTKATILKKEVK